MLGLKFLQVCPLGGLGLVGSGWWAQGGGLGVVGNVRDYCGQVGVA